MNFLITILLFDYLDKYIYFFKKFSFNLYNILTSTPLFYLFNIFFFIFSLYFIIEQFKNFIILNNFLLRYLSLLVSLLIFVISLLVFLKFDYFKFNLITIENKTNFGIKQEYFVDFFFFSSYFEIDGISIFFILLTTFITPICLLVSWEIESYLNYYISFFFLIEFFLIIAFTTSNLLIFFIAFESVLIPMFLIIGIWGTRFERIKAAYLFFLYTLSGSILFFLNLIIIQLNFGTLDINMLLFIEQFLNFKTKILIWIFFFISFSVKIPMFPFHIWLPEAHVEAPTAGSIMLAALLLKLGGYGFIRFSINLFPETSQYFSPAIIVIAIISIIFSSLISLRQLDLKRLIAYSSIAHMNYIVLGIFSFTYLGIIGSILLMLGHGLVSSALFLLVGILYDRHHVRLLPYYSGLVYVMPIFSFFFGFFTFSNMAFPGLSNFPGELLILIGLTEMNLFVSLNTFFGLFLSAVYSVWLLNRLIFGSLKIIYTKTYNDISRREFYSIFPLFFLTLIMGLFPNFFFDLIGFSVLIFF